MKTFKYIPVLVGVLSFPLYSAFFLTSAFADPEVQVYKNDQLVKKFVISKQDAQLTLDDERSMARVTPETIKITLNSDNSIGEMEVLGDVEFKSGMDYKNYDKTNFHVRPFFSRARDGVNSLSFVKKNYKILFRRVQAWDSPQKHDVNLYYIADEVHPSGEWFPSRRHPFYEDSRAMVRPFSFSRCFPSSVPEAEKYLRLDPGFPMEQQLADLEQNWQSKLESPSQEAALLRARIAQANEKHLGRQQMEISGENLELDSGFAHVRSSK